MNTFWNKRRKWWFVAVFGLAVLGVGGYFVARKVAWPAYKDWRSARLNRMAQEFVAAGDLSNALLTVRQNLRDNPRSIETWRLGVDIAKARDTSDAIFFQERLARMQPTAENNLELARLALKYGMLRQAQEALQALGDSSQRLPEFQELSATLQLRLGRPNAARYHFLSLLELQPDNVTAQLELARIDLLSDRARTNTEVRERLRRLAAHAEVRGRALGLLINDALAARNLPLLRELTPQLLAVPDLTPAQRIQALSAVGIYDAAQAGPMKDELRREWKENEEAAPLLMDYFMRAGRPAEAVEWYDSLSETMQQKPVMQEVAANALLAMSNWPRLERLLSTGKWENREYLRNALLAYGHRQAGRTPAFNEAWKLAVIEAGGDIRSATDLLGRVVSWGWENERYDLVWKLFALMPTNEAIRNQLVAWERAQGNTANLNRIFARMVEVTPNDIQAKNNFAYTSLLLDSNLSRAYLLASEVYRSDPKSPFFVTTQAYALYKQGKVDEALALMEGLSTAALLDPLRSVHRALLFAAAGDVERATDLLSARLPTRLLPEEQRLIERAQQYVQRSARTESTRTRLVSLQKGASGEGEVPSGEGWLKLLPEAARASVSVDMQLANTLYATRDFTGLGSAIKDERWGNYEYLRQALLAYTQRLGNSEAQSRATWRQALASAGRDAERQRQLAQLATEWSWQTERLEALDRLFERDPRDRLVLSELVDFHRANRRTRDIARVLSTYYAQNSGDLEQAAAMAYYSMLVDTNVSQAYVAARAAYDAAPNDAARRAIYAFSLWKQKRVGEALPLLEGLTPGNTGIVPLPLLHAAVHLDLGRRDDARREIELFATEGSLPEEASLATSIRRRIVDENPLR